MTNGLCPCTPKLPIPVAFTGGASAGNVFTGPNPIKNGSLGSGGVEPDAGTGLLVVSGASSKGTGSTL